MLVWVVLAGDSVPHWCVCQVQLAIRVGEFSLMRMAAAKVEPGAAGAQTCCAGSPGSLQAAEAAAACMCTAAPSSAQHKVCWPACLPVLQLRSMHDSKQEDIDAPLDVESTRDWKDHGEARC